MQMAPSPGVRIGPFSFGGLGPASGLFMGVTKLFDTVIHNSFDVGPTMIPAQMMQVDLASIGADVVVNVPVTATEGQCIGVLLYSDTAGTNTVTFAGPVLPVTLKYAGDCVLYTWDPFGYWAVTSQWRPSASKPFLSTQYYAPPGIGATVSPPPGQLASIDLAGNGGSAIVSLVAAAALAEDGELVGVQLVNTDPGSELTFDFPPTWGPLRTAGDIVFFTRSVSQNLWVPTAWNIETFSSYALDFTDADLVAGVLTVTHNLGTVDPSTSARGLTPIPVLYDNTGLVVQQAYGASLSSYAAAAVDANNTSITFDPVLLPLTGTWSVRVGGL